MSAIEITNFRPFQKGSLQAFFSMVLPSGLIVNEVRLFEKNGGRWLGMPSRKFTDKSGGGELLADPGISRLRKLRCFPRRRVDGAGRDPAGEETAHSGDSRR